MAPEKEIHLDVAGVGKAVESASRVVEGLISRICNPAAEELGLLFRDQVRHVRRKNLVRLAEKFSEVVAKRKPAAGWFVHPRLAYRVLDEASWVEDDRLQTMWAGLLAASHSPTGLDDGTLIFVDLLSRLTSSEALVLEFFCKHTEIEISGGLLVGRWSIVRKEQVRTITGIDDAHRIDRELDHMRSLELIRGGFSELSSDVATIAATTLGLRLFAKCNGHMGDPALFYQPSREKESQGQ